MRILGIDPGGQATGWCVVEDRQPVVYGILAREDDMPITDFAHMVATKLVGRVEQHKAGMVGIEGLVATVPHVHNKPINPYPIVETGVVLGAVWFALSGNTKIVEVRPGSHGSAPLRTYPPRLVGARETKGTGRMRHVRSAYDVALASRSALRIREASR